MEDNQNFMKVLFGIAIVVVIACIVIAIVATIGAIKFTDGCLTRYALDDANNIINADRVTNTISLRADGNYNTVTVVDSNNRSKVIPDPNNYGRWKNTGLVVNGGQKIKLKIRGEVSLCESYLPKNNLSYDNNLDKDNKIIRIPRVDEPEALGLIFDTRNNSWRNVLQAYKNDKIIIYLSKNGAGQVYDSFYKVIADATSDCVDGKASYSPLCGRYSPYKGVPYPIRCHYQCSLAVECKCNGFLNIDEWTAGCYSGDGRFYGCACSTADTNKCWNRWNRVWVNVQAAPEINIAPIFYTANNLISAENIMTSAPSVNVQCFGAGNINYSTDGGSYYMPNGGYVYGGGKDMFNHNDIPEDVKNLCRNFPNYFPTAYSDALAITRLPIPKLWCSADDACGVLYRFDSSESPTNATSIGSNYKIAQKTQDNTEQIIILDQIYVDNDVKYLQYRFYDQSTVLNDTGGYVFNVKHTKCRRNNGNYFNDPIMTNRGRVQYVVTQDGSSPDDASASYIVNDISVNDEGDSSIIISNNINRGSLWMRIYNHPDEYKNSVGQYNVQFFTSTDVGQFTLLIITPLLEKLHSMVNNASLQIFKNMTCYDGGGEEYASCISFFLYIKAMLVLYVITYGMLFLLGMVKISNLDLIIRIIKITLVAGLLDHRTFDFFNSFIFDFITGFSDQIIANMSGYSLFTSTDTIRNPFMFLDAIMSKIFFSKTFIAQLFALLSLGISGILYFIIVLIALIIFIITAFRAIAIYIMAFLSVAVLIGLAPLFLTFMLFDFTKYLFDNWVRFTFRYMIEPTILMAGIIIITQLFTIYLDFVLGYSVCWKCALAFKIPFPAIPGFNPAFLNVPLFCLNWFAPWGFDTNSGMMGINMQHVIALMILAYCAYGYINLSSKMVYKLTQTSGPSATSMGQQMSGAIEERVKSQFGMDENSQESIKDSAQKREKSMKSEKDNLESGSKRSGIKDGISSSTSSASKGLDLGNLKK